MSDTIHRILTYDKYATTPVDFSFALYISILRFLCFLRQFRRVLIQAHTFLKTEREPQGGEKASAKHQTKVRQPLGNPVFLTQVASGIMRGISLMCACRKEQSDGIAIATKSIASSAPARRAWRSQWGETHGEGGILN